MEAVAASQREFTTNIIGYMHNSDDQLFMFKIVYSDSQLKYQYGHSSVDYFSSIPPEYFSAVSSDFGAQALESQDSLALKFELTDEIILRYQAYTREHLEAVLSSSYRSPEELEIITSSEEQVWSLKAAEACNAFYIKIVQKTVEDDDYQILRHYLDRLLKESFDMYNHFIKNVIAKVAYILKGHYNEATSIKNIIKAANEKYKASSSYRHGYKTFNETSGMTTPEYLAFLFEENDYIIQCIAIISNDYQNSKSKNGLGRSMSFPINHRYYINHES